MIDQAIAPLLYRLQLLLLDRGAGIFYTRIRSACLSQVQTFVNEQKKNGRRDKSRPVPKNFEDDGFLI